MKLLNLTNRYYIAIAVGLLLVSSLFLAYRVLYLVDQEISEHMLYEKQLIERQLKNQKQLQRIPITLGDKIHIVPIDKFTTFKVQVKDTLMADAFEGIRLPFRIMTYEQQINKEAYRITLTHRLTENESLFYGIIFSVILVAVDIIACFYFLNRWFSSKIWRPFYRAINILKNFDLQHGNKILFQRSTVDEFNTLNAELTRLTGKVARDYRNLKEFTENMSHETQTPLAIIRSKLELLLQSENLTDEQVGHIRSILDSVSRLSKMNKSLILLTRIENEQYASEELMALGPVLIKHLKDLDLFISSRDLKLETQINEDINLRINPHLAEILITNLLSNAIKYNIPGGVLRVELTREYLRIANSGKPLTLPGEQVFERFKRGDILDSMGLGLAIVKKICDHCHCFIEYGFKSELHSFTVYFQPQKVVAPIRETILLK
ncbi:MAG: HAMP domain-containing histidine kinase [Bacteroidia bacterium]|nr:HAMP domain-containing histidine kinase [Bacteroidia bacterium]